jgi:hypothetical protein
MMEDEYKSALLWYKDDLKQPRVKPAKEPSKKTKSSLFTTLATRLKTATTPPKKPKGKAQNKPLPLLKKPKEKTIKPLISAKDISKEKILAKIRREQDRQYRKLQ